MTSNRYSISLSPDHIRKILKRAYHTSAPFKSLIQTQWPIATIDNSFLGEPENCVSSQLICNESRIDNGVVNGIFIVTISSLEDEKKLEFILKLSSPQWRHFKTLNEVTIMKMLKEMDSNAPIPEIYLSEDGSDESSLKELGGYEFILMEKCQGVVLSEIYETLDTDIRKEYIRQIAEIRGGISQFKFKLFH